MQLRSWRIIEKNDSAHYSLSVLSWFQFFSRTQFIVTQYTPFFGDRDNGVTTWCRQSHSGSGAPSYMTMVFGVLTLAHLYLFFSTQGAIYSLSFSPDGRYLASSGNLSFGLKLTCSALSNTISLREIKLFYRLPVGIVSNYPDAVHC